MILASSDENQALHISSIQGPGMDITLGVIFLGLELAFISLALLAIVHTGFARLGSPVGIARDGFPPGRGVPSWALPDVEGRLHATPGRDQWQMLLFAILSLLP